MAKKRNRQSRTERHQTSSKKKGKSWIKWIIALALIAAVGSALGNNDDTEQQSPENTTTTEATTVNETTLEETLSADATSEQVATFESENEETQTSSQDYDLGELNSKVLDSFIEASEFNQQGADGYEWTLYVKDIEINNKEAIHVNVINDFMLLDDSSKTEVLDSVQRCVGLQYFLLTEIQRSFYTTAFDESGNKVAQSEMFNLNSYKFY